MKAGLKSDYIKLRLKCLKSLNDSFLFYKEVESLIEEKQKENNTDEWIVMSIDRIVPSLNNDFKLIYKSATRDEVGIKNLYTSGLNEIIENSIIANISKFEALLFDVLKLALTYKPDALNKKYDKIDFIKPELHMIFQAEDLEQLINTVIHQNINNVIRSAPKDYLKFFSEVTGVNIEKDEFNHYIEIKATRDLIVHHSKTIDKEYVKKAGKLARGRINEHIKVDYEYFEFSIAVMKKCLARINSTKMFNPKK